MIIKKKTLINSDKKNTDRLQEISKAFTLNEECEKFVMVHLKVAAVCIP